MFITDESELPEGWLSWSNAENTQETGELFQLRMPDATYIIEVCWWPTPVEWWLCRSYKNNNFNFPFGYFETDSRELVDRWLVGEMARIAYL